MMAWIYKILYHHVQFQKIVILAIEFIRISWVTEFQASHSIYKQSRMLNSFLNSAIILGRYSKCRSLLKKNISVITLQTVYYTLIHMLDQQCIWWQKTVFSHFEQWVLGGLYNCASATKFYYLQVSLFSCSVLGLS